MESGALHSEQPKLPSHSQRTWYWLALSKATQHSSSSCNVMARYHDAPERAAAKSAIDRQRYSLYQPVNGKTARKSSVSKHGDKAQRERENTASRASADPATGRRRGTMRSKEHDDEEELLQRALEESRREVDAAGTGRRNGKRLRDDSDE